MTTAQQRTDELLAHFKGLKDEFMMLKGILCMSHGLTDRGDEQAAWELFDRRRIAARMDQINEEVLTHTLAAQISTFRKR